MEHGNSRLHAVYNNTSVFRIAYIIDLFLCSIGYVNILAEFGKIIFFVWGLSIFFNRYIFESNIKKVNYYGWLVLFIASNIITILLRGYSEGIWENILMVLNMPIIFFLFYGLHSESTVQSGRKRIFKELYILSNIFVWLSLVVNLLSLFTLYYIGKSINYTFGYLVVYENRFTGIYFNPNLMAFSSFCAMVCCHILTKPNFVKLVTNKNTSVFMKIIIGISFGLNVAVIFLSDSNATAVIMIFYAVMTLCYRFFGGNKLNLRSIIRRGGILVLSLTVITAGVFCFRAVFQTGTSYTINTPEDSGNVFEDQGDELNNITFEHQNENLDSGRIKLLFQGLNVIKHYPFFGVGKGNITKYGNHFNDNKMKYSDFHNGYLTIMVCSGMIGFLLFLAFAVCLCKRMTVLLFGICPRLTKDVFPCLFSFIFAYCIYSLFEKTMVFEVSFMITFFWLILGYAASCMAQYEEDGYKEIAFVTFESFKNKIFCFRKKDENNIQQEKF